MNTTIKGLVALLLLASIFMVTNIGNAFRQIELGIADGRGKSIQ